MRLLGVIVSFYDGTAGGAGQDNGSLLFKAFAFRFMIDKYKGFVIEYKKQRSDRYGKKRATFKYLPQGV